MFTKTNCKSVRAAYYLTLKTVSLNSNEVDYFQIIICTYELKETEKIESLTEIETKLKESKNNISIYWEFTPIIALK